MPLNEKQLRILEVINAGNISGASIAQTLGTSMQMIRYYLDTLAEDGYLRAAKVFDNQTREFQIVRAYLTEEGKAALDRASSKPDEKLVADSQIAETPQTSLEFDLNFDLNKDLPEDITAILQSLNVLKEIIDKLPEGRRELAIVYFEDLQAEIKIGHRRKPQRIKAYFLAVLSLIFPIVKQIDDATGFLECTKILSSKLNIPVKLPSL